jgi:hypothetical protein
MTPLLSSQFCTSELFLESRAALTYLVSQHKPGQLYPTCTKKRSLVDQRLYFNIGRERFSKKGLCNVFIIFWLFYRTNQLAI